MKLYEHYLHPKDYLNKAFSEIPSNAFVNKGRCGSGGTTIELKNSRRCSLIVDPTVGILKNKKASHPDLFIIWEKVTVEEVTDVLRANRPAQKIMCTPEGIIKVIKAATALGKLDELYEKWFILLDECHTFISDDHRKDILRPFDYFWLFKHKAIISATPYFFSDPRISELDYYEIKFTEKLGTITLVDCTSVYAALIDILRQAQTQEGRLHIFLNSVTAIAFVINYARLIDVAIFCANDKERENMRKLGDLRQNFVEQPNADSFCKVNFYTSRYFEGWDMFDEDATIILATDIHNQHTKVSVNMKLKQAAGRLRNDATQIIHLTNHYGTYLPGKSIDEIKKDCYDYAAHLLKQHEEDLAYCKANNRKIEINPVLERFADIAYKTKIATLNPYKIDQQINHAYSDQSYDNILFLKDEWEKGYFNVEMKECKLKLETNTAMKRKSKAQQLKEDYLALQAYKTNPGFHLGTTPEERIKTTNPLAYQAFALLTEDKMNELSYNVKKVAEEVILASNNQEEHKLLQLVGNTFKQGDRLSIDEIIGKLQAIYDRLQLKDPKTGKPWKAKATDLRNKGWFEIHDCKIGDFPGPLQNGFIIVRCHFAIRAVA